MIIRQYILGLVFLVSTSFALCNTEFTYNIIDGGIEVTGCDGTCPEELLLPAKINGIDVTNIADNAFKESGIKKIVIPNSTNISSKAFASNSLLEVVFLDDLGVVSEDAFLIAEHNKYPEIFLKNAQRLEHKLKIEQLYAELEYLESQIPDSCICLPDDPPVYDPPVYDPIDYAHRRDMIEAEILFLEVTLLAIETEIYDLITSSYITLNDASIEYSGLKQNYDSCASDDFSCKLTADIALYKYSHCDENDEICIAAAYRGDEILREDVFYYCSNSTGIAEKSIATSKSYFYELTELYDYDGCYSSCPECMDCGGMPPIPEGSEIIERVYTHSSTPELKQNCDEIISDYPLEIFDSEQVKTDYSILDMDQNGNFDALTDGLILIRYAFGLRGDSLISNAVASDANRTSAEEIETHIQSLLP